MCVSVCERGERPPSYRPPAQNPNSSAASSKMCREQMDLTTHGPQSLHQKPHDVHELRTRPHLKLSGAARTEQQKTLGDGFEKKLDRPPRLLPWTASLGPSSPAPPLPELLAFLFFFIFELIFVPFISFPTLIKHFHFPQIFMCSFCSFSCSFCSFWMEQNPNLKLVWVWGGEEGYNPLPLSKPRACRQPCCTSWTCGISCTI